MLKTTANVIGIFFSDRNSGKYMYQVSLASSLHLISNTGLLENVNIIRYFFHSCFKNIYFIILIILILTSSRIEKNMNKVL